MKVRSYIECESPLLFRRVIAYLGLVLWVVEKQVKNSIGFPPSIFAFSLNTYRQQYLMFHVTSDHSNRFLCST